MTNTMAVIIITPVMKAHCILVIYMTVLTPSYWGADADGNGVRAKGVEGNWNRNIGGASRTERRNILSFTIDL